jgi:hypothetical protein
MAEEITGYSEEELMSHSEGKDRIYFSGISPAPQHDSLGECLCWPGSAWSE